MRLETLFGSRTRVKLLRLFFSKPTQAVFVREISRAIDEQINSVRRELQNLESIGLVRSATRNQKKYYELNREFPLYTELSQFIIKANFLQQQELFTPLQTIDTVLYIALLGYFTQDSTADIDIFVVGDLQKKTIETLLSDFQKRFSISLRFTMMKKDEFAYRKTVTDKFLYKILESSKIVLLDRLGLESGGTT